jgi:hypothetical protein
MISPERTYTLPTAIDLFNIESLLAAREAEARDHLLALREEPGYFAEALQGTVNHLPHNIVDAKGKKGPLFEPQDQIRSSFGPSLFLSSSRTLTKTARSPPTLQITLGRFARLSKAPYGRHHARLLTSRCARPLNTRSNK